MAFTSTDPFLRATVDSIGVFSQTKASFKEINLRLSISRQDIYWRVRAADDYAHDFQSLSSQRITEERYYLETKALFGFFTSALSALECFFYAAYFVGNAAADPTKITPGTSQERFERFHLVSFFTDHFYNDPFTQSLLVFIGRKGTKTPADPRLRDIKFSIFARHLNSARAIFSNANNLLRGCLSELSYFFCGQCLMNYRKNTNNSLFHRTLFKSQVRRF